MSDRFEPTPDEKFTFGLWTVGNPGGDPFGEAVRPTLSPVEIVHMLADVGAYGVNLHDNDLYPIDAAPAERNKLISDFKQALEETGLRTVMGSTNLFSDPIFKDGAYTSNDAEVRAYALKKTMQAVDLLAELEGDTYVCWGGREGVESDATKDPREALKRMRGALNFLCEYIREQGYDLNVALEAKPNEPRGDIYLPTTGAMLGFIETLEYPEMVGVNPEVAHEHMSGLNFLHAIAQAWDAGKLFHIDLNDQNFARFDQDYRFASQNYKQNFFVVKFLEDVGYDGPKHYDAHAYRTEDYEGVKDFARGCMRSYMVLKEKVRQFQEDREIQGLLQDIESSGNTGNSSVSSYSSEQVQSLKERSFDREAIAQRGLQYERLDQLVFELLMGVR